MAEENSKKLYFETVWYASEEYAKGHVKFIAYEEIGDLLLTQKDGKLEVQFLQESKIKFRIADIIKVYRARQGFPYFLYIFGITIYLVFGAIGGLGNLLYVIFMIAISLPLGLLIYFSQRWVVIKSKHQGEIKQYYFYDGRHKGYAGRFGGNKKIYRTIRKMMD